MVVVVVVVVRLFVGCSCSCVVSMAAMVLLLVLEVSWFFAAHPSSPPQQVKGDVNARQQLDVPLLTPIWMAPQGNVAQFVKLLWLGCSQGNMQPEQTIKVFNGCFKLLIALLHNQVCKCRY